MSNQTVVDVIISGSTTTIVDKRINGVTTVAGAPPITNVSGQVPDLGVNTDILAAEGDILSLTNDVANLRANLIVTGTTLTDEIGVLSGHVISTGNNLEFQISTLSGNLIASGNNLNSLRDILSGNLAATGSNLKASITGITGDINTLTSNLISTGDNLQTQILNSGDILDDLSGNLITTGQTLTSNLISTGNLIQPQIDNIESNLITTGQTLLTTGSNLQALIVDNTNNLIDTGNNLEPRINTNVVNISTLNTVTGVLSTATGELQEYKFNKSGGTISGSLLPSSSGIFNLGSPSLTFQTGYFDDLEAENTLFVGGVPIKSVDGGINFFDATGIAAFRDVSIRNLTVTGTETIIDVEHLAVKDNIIIINSGESGAGIGVRSGGLVIDRGTLPDADFLFNENNDRFEIDFPLAVNGNVVVTQNQTGVYASSSNLTQTGVTLQNQITSNDTDITNLGTATGELKTQSNATDSNLTATGQTLTSEIAIVSGIAGGSTFDALSGNLITTGQTLTSEIAIVSGMAGGSDLATLSGNLISTGQTLQTQITSNDSDISTLTSNLVTTGSRVDDVSGNLITTGQTLQTQIASNDSDIVTLTSNLTQTGVNVMNLLIETGFAILDTSGNANTISGNLISTGKYLTDEIATVSGMATGGAAADTISGDLITTGQTLTSEIGIVSGLTVTNTNNLISTGNNLQGQITSNDGQIAGIIGDLINTGQTLTTNDNTISSNLITTGQTLTSEIAIVSGIATGGSAQDFRELSGNLITTGQTLQAQVTSNDSDVTSLTSNLITTGQTLTSEIAIVSGLAGGGDIDTLSGNLITTGQTLQTQITSNDSDITNLTSNLGTTGQTLQTQITSNDSDISTLTSNLVTTGQTLTTDITTVSGLIVDNDGDITALKTATGVLKTSTDSNSANLITTGQTLQTQITSNDSDISSLTSNLVTTGQTLQTQITSNDGDISTLTTNLGTTGQTLQTQITSNDSDISTLTSNLITTGQTLTTDISTVSGLITDNDADIAALRSATGVLKTSTDANTTNLITTGQTLQTQITSNDGDITTLTSNLVTTGQTLQTQITSNDSDISTLTTNVGATGQTLQTQITSNDSDITNLTNNLITTGQTVTTDINTVSGLITDNDADITALKTATGVLKTSSDSNTANLITTGQTLQTQISSNDSDISTLTSNLVTTGQTLTTNINTVSSNLVSTGEVIDDVSGNLIITGQTLQTQITSNDGDITTLTSNLVTTGQTLTTNINTVSTNLVSTGAVVDDISGNLITTGQTLQTQINSNDGDITTLTSNLVTTGQTLTTNINTVSTNLGTSGQTLQTQITSNDSDISTLTSNLGTTGQTLQTQITSNDSDIASLTTNLGTTGQTLQTQITSNDSDISTLDSTTVKLTTNQSIAGNKIFTNNVTINNLTVTGTEVIVDVENLAVKDNIIEINSGESSAGISKISGGIVIDRGTATNANILFNDANDRFELNFPLAVEGEVVASASNLITTGQTLTTNINTVSTNLGTSGQTLQTQITSNDSDISTLTTNLGTSGQTLQTQITSNDSDISTLTTNLGTSGQTLQTQITSNDSDISTLTSNLVTTGQTLQTQITSNDSDISTLTTNVGITGQTLQTQITSNDSDISTLTSNLVTTGQTLTTNINTVSTNLGASGQTLQTQITSNDTDITNLTSNLVTTGQTLTTNINTVANNLGTTGQTLTSEIATVSGLIPATVIDGAGTANKVPLWSDSNTIGDSVISQSSSKVGIGVASPNKKLEVVDSAAAQILAKGWGPDSVGNDGGAIQLGEESAFHGLFSYDNATSILYIDNAYNSAAGDIRFRTKTSGTAITAVTIEGDGDVGIGTASPSQKLHVNVGRIAVTDGYNIGDTDADTGMFPSSNALFFQTAGTTRAAITSAGLFGIGTASPSFLLHLQHATTPTIRVDNTVNNSRLDLRAEDSAVLIRSTSNFPMRFDVNQTERMRIDTAGLVGIGTVTPASLLHIYSSAPVFTVQDGGAWGTNATAYVDLKDGTSSMAYVGVTGTDGHLDIKQLKAGSLRLYTNNTERVSILSDGNVGIGTVAPGTELHVKGAGTVAQFEGTGGNVFIQFKDSDDGTLAFIGADGGDLKFQTPTGSYSDKLTIKNDGKVGIGTVSPSAGLHVVNTTDPTVLFESTNAGSSGSRLQLYHNSGSPADNDILSNIQMAGEDSSGAKRYAALIQTIAADVNASSVDGDIRFLTYKSDTASEVMRITHDASVGIGTASPSANLTCLGVTGTTIIQALGADSNGFADVEIKSTGTTGASRLFFSDTAAQSGFIKYNHSDNSMQFGTSASVRMHIDTSGNVGIGTDNPKYKLDANAGLSSGGGIGYPVRVGHGSMATNGDGVGVLFSRGSAEQYFGYVRIQSTQSNPNFLNPRLEFGIQDTGTYNLADASTRMVITGSGNVGIGTVSPDAKLHIKAPDISVPAEIRLEHNDGITQTAKIVFNQTGENKLVLSTQYQSSTDLNLIQFAPADNVAMTIRGGTGTSDGFVGIGTASPGSKLHVIEADTGEAFRIDGASSGFAMIVEGGTSYKTRMRGGVTIGSGYGASTPPANGLIVEGCVGIGTASPAYELEVSTASNSRITASNTGYSVVNHLQADNTGGWVGTLSNHPLIIKTNNTEKVRVTTAGSVGIGTDPKAKFEVDLNQTSGTLAADNYAHFGGQHHSNGSVMGITLGYREANLLYRKVGIVARGLGDNAARQDLAFLVSTVNSSTSVTPSDAKLTISGLTGYVGIGTAIPSSKLHISGADNTSAKITLTNTAPSPDNQWSLHAGYNDQSLRFLGDSTTVMTLLDSGKVGIGTVSPAVQLHTHVTSGHNSIYITTDGTSSAQTALWFAHNYSSSADYAGIIWGTDNLLRINNSGSSTASHIVINEDGKVGIGNAGPGDQYGNGNNLVIGTNSGDNGMTICAGTSNEGGIFFADGASGADEYRGQIKYSHSNNDFVFAVNAAEVVRFNSNGSITSSTGASLTSGGAWTDASSRELKKDIVNLSLIKASQVVKLLNPVEFSYKTSPEERRVGFIAEDVPDLVASEDKKGLSSMQIVAALTKVVQNQQKEIESCKKQIEKLSKLIAKKV